MVDDLRFLSRLSAAVQGEVAFRLETFRVAYFQSSTEGDSFLKLLTPLHPTPAFKTQIEHEETFVSLRIVPLKEI